MVYLFWYVNSGKHNVYRMSAASSEEKEEWMKNIKSVCAQSVVKFVSQHCVTVATHADSSRGGF